MPILRICRRPNRNRDSTSEQTMMGIIIILGYARVDWWVVNAIILSRIHPSSHLRATSNVGPSRIVRLTCQWNCISSLGMKDMCGASNLRGGRTGGCLWTTIPKSKILYTKIIGVELNPLSPLSYSPTASKKFRNEKIQMFLCQKFDHNSYWEMPFRA